MIAATTTAQTVSETFIEGSAASAIGSDDESESMAKAYGWGMHPSSRNGIGDDRGRFNP